MKKLLALGIAAAAAASIQPALAYEAGDMFIRAGSITVDPDADSGKADITITNYSDPAYSVGLGEVDGTSLDVDDDTQFGISFNYMLHQYFGLELLAATPFKHNIDFESNAGGLGDYIPDGKYDLGSTKHLPPTLFANFYPMGACSKIQPYVGIGINYTNFFDEDVKDSFGNALANAFGALTLDTANALAVNGEWDRYEATLTSSDLELDDSWGIVAQAGIDWEFMDHWILNASVAWADIGTEATLKGSHDVSLYDDDQVLPIFHGNQRFEIQVDDLDIDPWIYRVNVGYRF